MPEPNGSKWAEWGLLAIVVILLIVIFDSVRAQDSPPEPIRCGNGYCLIREQQLVEISVALARMREQLEQYAKLCKWGDR